ncbi:hypothetical protein [Paenibacillus mendelii]|uniref:DUF4432 domain-containing protein n=1 Tax=Paenibacillus mendelii TaxID=206163 RepID=A0ABV6JJZ5_9BACL|nr:hypothetical protein [Paenibacillus mendelii]MCQ6559162.1 aldose 1-epimerase family protein [Paenibacillus mendelii]
MSDRNYGCRIKTDLTYKGYDALIMENESFRLMMLPGKGSDVIELLYKPTDMDFCWLTRMGLRGREAAFNDFQGQYEGGWQEILPNLAGKHMHQGIQMESYGEVSLTRWTHAIVKNTPEEIAVTFANRLRTMPLLIEKTIVMTSGEPGFRLREKAANLSPAVLHADWGHHITFGTPFLTPGTRIFLPDGTDSPFIVPERGQPGGFDTLPAGSGVYRLVRPDGLGAEVGWDAAKWPHLWFWRDFGGDTSPPYYGCHYNVGLEMFTSPPAASLQESIDRGTAMRWAPYGETESHLTFAVLTEDGREAGRGKK